MKNILKILLIGFIGIAVQSCYYDELVPVFEEPIVIDPDNPITFKKDIAPIFNNNNNCTSCHGGSQAPDLRNTQTAYTNLIANFVIKGDAVSSRLYKRASEIKNGEHFGSINATQLATMKAWIDSDAKYE